MLNGSNTPTEQKDRWRTPKPVFNYSKKMLNREIIFDTACTLENSLSTPVWTPANENALAYAWNRQDAGYFCNPPYSDIDPWVEHILKQTGRIALLIPSPNGEDRYLDISPRAFEVNIVGRIAFLNPQGKPIPGNTRGSSLFFFNIGWMGQRITIHRNIIFSEGEASHDASV